MNFVKMDWQAAERHRVSVEYNRARWTAPAGARAGAVVDRGVASMGNSYRERGCSGGAVVWSLSARASNEVAGASWARAAV